MRVNYQNSPTSNFLGLRFLVLNAPLPRKTMPLVKPPELVFFNTIKFHQISVKPPEILEITKGWLMVDGKIPTV